MVDDPLVEQELPQSLQVKATMDTPHARWREMHQSGRSCTIERKRSLPQPGTHVTVFAFPMIFFRRSFFCMEMNHCSVARKITGFLQRQQWG